jgi:hypothetical protein
MKLSQKRNCNGCKGGSYESNPFRQKCWLGCSVKSIDGMGIPQEPCYKPMTYGLYISASKMLDAS